jgi:hypothetical protein
MEPNSRRLEPYRPLLITKEVLLRNESIAQKIILTQIAHGKLLVDQQGPKLPRQLLVSPHQQLVTAAPLAVRRTTRPILIRSLKIYKGFHLMSVSVPNARKFVFAHARVRLEGAREVGFVAQADRGSAVVAFGFRVEHLATSEVADYWVLFVVVGSETALF